MKRRIGPLLVGFGVFIIVLTQFQNCSNYSQNGFGQNASTLTTQASAQTFFLSPKPSIVNVNVGEDKIMIGGACDYGSYPNHYVEFQLFAKEGNPMFAANTAIRLRNDATCQSSAALSCFKFSNVKCEHGKFFAHIPVIPGVVGDVNGMAYRLTGTLVLVDSSNVEHRDLYPPQNTEVVVFSPN